MYTFICISCKWHCPLKIKQKSLLAHSAMSLGRFGFGFVKWKGVYCVHLAYVLLKCWTLDLLWGVTTLFVNRIELGRYLLWDKAFNVVPSKGLAKETFLLSCEMQWTLAPFGRPPSPPCPEPMCNGWCWYVSLCEWTLCIRCGSM